MYLTFIRTVLFIFLIVFSSLSAIHAQVGVNTRNPTASLHVTGSGSSTSNTYHPIKLDGVVQDNSNLNKYLKIDANGNVYTADGVGNLPFMSSGANSSSGISLTYTNPSTETGDLLYPNRVLTTSELANWRDIPGLQVNFEPTWANNVIMISVEGGAIVSHVTNANNAFSFGSSIDYAVGIFIGNELISSRVFTARGFGFPNQDSKWMLLARKENLSVNNHSISVKVTRRSSRNANNFTLYMARGQNNTTSTNETRAVLQISGYYSNL